MNLPRMSLHIGDYLSGTGHLTTTEHGAYLLLIMHYWRNAGLPDDERQLAAIVRMAPNEWRRSRDVLKAFFKTGWRHKRIDEELRKAEATYRAAVENGKKGGRPRSDRTRTKPHPIPNPNPAPNQPISYNPYPESFSREESQQEGNGPSSEGAVVVPLRPVGGAA